MFGRVNAWQIAKYVQSDRQESLVNRYIDSAIQVIFKYNLYGFSLTNHG